MKVNQDGFENIVTGLGGADDATAHNRFTPGIILDSAMLSVIYRSNGLAQRAVRRPAEDMCREWFTIDSPSGEKILDRLETLRARATLLEATTLARLYGGCGLLAVTEETDFASAWRGKELSGLHVVPRNRITFDTDTVSADPMRRLSGLPDFYNVEQRGRNRISDRVRVHHSRLKLIPGAFTDEFSRDMHNGWWDSVLQAAYEDILRYGASLGYTANILKEFVQTILRVKGLTRMILGKEDDAVVRRLRMLDMSKSILNTIILDADGEEITRYSASVTGVPELLDRFAEALSVSTNTPISVLFGRTPSGLNSTGESDLTIYRDFIRSEQERVLSPVAEWLVELLGAEGDWSIKWNSLERENETEEATLRKTVAETDVAYINAGVLSADEVAQSRFGTGAWSIETHLIDGTERSEEASPAGAPEAPEQPNPDVPVPNGEADAEVRGDQGEENKPLYVRRDVVQTASLEAWAERLGLVLNDDLHVTVTYSTTPVNWYKMNQTYSDELVLPAGGPRGLDVFGTPELGYVLVLRFASYELEWRHYEMRDRGASSKFAEYKPHITLCAWEQDRPVPDNFEAYRGELRFGPEIFEEVKP